MMKVETLLNLATSLFRQKLRENCPASTLPDLSPDAFNHLVQAFKSAFSACGTESLKAYVESCEEKADVLVSPGGPVRFKMVCKKEFLTPFGWVGVERRLYQADAGGVSFVPIDEKWDMRNESMTPLVREVLHFASGQDTPGEVERLLEKCALFTPSRTAILHANEGFGAFWKVHGEKIVAKVRDKETVPSLTKAMVVSLDGVNVLMHESGKKRGRKKRKPMNHPSEETPTSYQNAMVGSVSLHRSPEKEEKGPQRLSSRYVAQMPEDGFAGFRSKLEAEVAATVKKLPPRCHKVLLLDGSRALWNYVDDNPLYRRYLKVVDYFHATEYLAKAAEAAYGSATYDSQGWFRKWKERLLTERGVASKVIRAMDYLLKTTQLKGERRKDLLAARRFFRNNAHRMKYSWFHARGLPVGSGVVEAACKSVVKARMCRSGMRWTQGGGQTILSLRSLIKSNRWQECWDECQALRLAA
jgi:hypothetical protein